MATVPGQAFLQVGRPPDPREPQWRGNLPAFLLEQSKWLSNLALELMRHSDIQDLAIGQAYTPSNVTATRTYDADASSVAELADVMGTLIADMQEKGILS